MNALPDEHPLDQPVRRPDLARRGLGTLRRAVAGRVVLAGDADWDGARSAWNLTIQQNPLAIVEVADAEDVRRAVQWAVDHRCQVTAQPLGHGARGTLDEVLLLRTRALNGIELDLATRTARVDAGVKAGELLAALDRTGLTFLAGSSPDPTVVAMTIGGGLSWFGRRHGLAANAIVSIDLVDGLGRSRHLTHEHDPDLFWAVRGGGGDFGIVTALEIRLFPAEHLYGGRLLWPIESMPAVLRTFRDLTATAPDTVSLWYQTYRFPDLPMIPERDRGRSFAAVAATVLGSDAEAECLLEPLRNLPGLVMDLMGTLPVKDLADVTDEPVDPAPITTHSMLLDDLTDDVIDRLTAAVGADSPSLLPIVEIRHLGGAFTHHHRGHGAAGHIKEPYLLFAVGVLAAPELAAPIAATFVSIDKAVAGHTHGRTVPNFVGAGDEVWQGWTPETRHRLGRIKREVDPRSTIHSNRPVAAG